MAPPAPATGINCGATTSTGISSSYDGGGFGFFFDPLASFLVVTDAPPSDGSARPIMDTNVGTIMEREYISIIQVYITVAVNIVSIMYNNTSVTDARVNNTEIIHAGIKILFCIITSSLYE